MAHITVETWIHRYPAAGLWETNSWYVKIRFNGRWTAQEGWFKDRDAAVKLAREIAEELDGVYQGDDETDRWRDTE